MMHKMMKLALFTIAVVGMNTPAFAANRCVKADGNPYDPVVWNSQAHKNQGKAGNPQYWGRKTYVERCHANHEGFAYTKVMIETSFEPLMAAGQHPGIYAMINKANGIPMILPTAPNAPCVAIPANHKLDVCMAGCFSGSQLLLFKDGYESAKKANDKQKRGIVTMAPDSTMENIEYDANDIMYYNESAAPEQNQAMLQFYMTDGGYLEVTPGHALVAENGEFVLAGTLSEGDKLVQANGKSVSIEKIDSYSVSGEKVYHVQPLRADSPGQVIVAQGYLSGSHILQTADVRAIHRILERSGWTDEPIDEGDQDDEDQSDDSSDESDWDTVSHDDDRDDIEVVID